MESSWSSGGWGGGGGGGMDLTSGLSQIFSTLMSLKGKFFVWVFFFKFTKCNLLIAMKLTNFIINFFWIRLGGGGGGWPSSGGMMMSGGWGGGGDMSNMVIYIYMN